MTKLARQKKEKELERELFFEKVNKEFAELKKDPVAWNEYLDEFAEWNAMPGPEINDEYGKY